MTPYVGHFAEKPVATPKRRRMIMVSVGIREVQIDTAMNREPSVQTSTR